MFQRFPARSGDFPASFLQNPAGSGGRNHRPGLKSKEFWLSDFIIEHAELQVISEFEKTILQPVFVNVCKEFK
jgi:hypothetical protein